MIKIIAIIFTSLSTIFMIGNTLLFDFNKETSSNSWRIVDDVVMGGRSQGSFSVNENGVGVFSGSVSLENNGGFSSLRHRLNEFDCSAYQHFVLKIKGDGEKYQFRVKSSRSDYHSYIFEFTTTGEWEEIKIPFIKMYPAFRGRTLNMPNYPGQVASEIAFLIGNKKPQQFELLVDYIKIEN